jgi:hypothetical protein
MKLYKELIELVASGAGPLHWVMHEDADAAKVWEIKASALLASIKEEENEVSHDNRRTRTTNK